MEVKKKKKQSNTVDNVTSKSKQEISESMVSNFTEIKKNEDKKRGFV